jgi:predicted nucleotidyltransferase
MSDGSATRRLPPLVQATLDAFVSGVRERFGSRVTTITLFGSYARGQAHEESDIDCLILLDWLDAADDRVITDMAADLIWEIGGAVISPLVMSVAEFERWKATERRAPIEIARDGIPL